MAEEYKSTEEIIEGGIKKDILIVKDGRITYKSTKKSYNFKDPEEPIRARVYVELIEKYKYLTKRIDTEVVPPRREPKLPADIVVYEDDEWEKVYIVVETKAKSLKTDIEVGKREGLGNANLLNAKYLFVVCDEEEMAYDVKNNPSLKSLEKYRMPQIPIAYGKLPKYRYKKGTEEFFDLRRANFNELKNKFQRCHDEIWEGGKRDPSESFDEMSKLMFAKIYDERFTKNGEYYNFQIGTFEDIHIVANKVKKLYKTAKNKEPGVFTGELKVPERVIYEIVEILQNISLMQTDLDAKGRAFEHFLGEIFRGKLGQYFTRREIVEFMVDMLEPTEEDLVIDPACGSGGFLLYTMMSVREKIYRDYAGDEKSINRIDYDFSHKQIFGIEINDRIARVAMMDMVIHDDGHSNIECHDALDDYKEFDPRKDLKQGKYSLLLTNPPFGAVVKDDKILKLHELGSKIKKRKSQKTEILFIERCLDLLKPGGRMGIVLPDGILTNSSLQYVRDFIEENAKILAVVSLPQGTFVPSGSGVKASLLFLQKKKEGEELGDYPIFMAIVDHVGYDSTGRPDKNDFPNILEDWEKFKSGEMDFHEAPLAFAVKRGELEGRCNPEYYHPERIKSIKLLSKSRYPPVNFEEVIEFRKSKLNPQEHPTKLFNYLSLANILSHTGEIVDFTQTEGENILSSSSLFKRSDILFARLRPYLNKVYLAQGDIGEGICSTEFLVLKPNKEINPLFLQTFLLSSFVLNQTKHMMTGNTLPRMSREDVCNIKIPIPPRYIQDKITQIMEDAYKQKKEKFKEAEELLTNINDYVLDKLGIEMPEIEEKKTFTLKFSELEQRHDPFYYQPKYSKILNSQKKNALETTRLGELCNTISNGCTPPKEQYSYTGISILKVANLTKQGIDWSSIAYIPKQFYEKSKKAHIKLNDLLLLSSAHQSDYLGKKVEIVDEIPTEFENECMTVGELIIIRTNEIKLNPYYLLSYLRLPYTKLLIRRYVRGQSAHLYPKDIAMLEIPIPPIEIQNEIADEVKRRREKAKQLKIEAEEILREAKQKVEKMILGQK